MRHATRSGFMRLSRFPRRGGSARVRILIDSEESERVAYLVNWTVTDTAQFRKSGPGSNMD